MRRTALAIMLAAGCGLGTAQAQTFPQRPIRIVVAVAPGTAADVIARYFAEKLTQSLGSSVVVENRVGAGGNIALSAVAKSPADGYTLMLGAFGQLVVNPYVYPNLDFDVDKDFEPIAMLANLPLAIIANPAFPVNNLQELLAMVKAKPGTVNLAITNSSSRVALELLERSIGAKFYRVDYGSPSPAFVDLISGRTSVMVETALGVRPHVQSGKVKALAVTSRKSSAVLPGVKSVQEQGVEGFGEVTGWLALYAPRNVPRPIVELINAQVNKALALPETAARIVELGAEPAAPGTAAELDSFAKAERSRWGPIIKAAKISVN